MKNLYCKLNSLTKGSWLLPRENSSQEGMTFPLYRCQLPAEPGSDSQLWYWTEQTRANRHASEFLHLETFSSSSSLSFHPFLYLKFPIPGMNSKMHPNSWSILSQKMKWLFLQTHWVGSMAIRTSDRWFHKLKRTVVHLWSLVYIYLSRQGYCFLFIFFQLYLLRYNLHVTLCKFNVCNVKIVLPQ